MFNKEHKIYVYIINKNAAIEKLKIEFEIMTRIKKMVCVYIFNSSNKAKSKYLHLILLRECIQNCIHDASIIELKLQEIIFIK